MDLRQLRYFAQIAESGNVSRAAEVLRIAQPSLSQQMRNLEDELGVPLLFRHARGVTPTELGLKFYEHARRILQEVERAKEVMRSQATSPSGRISVGLPTSACRGLSLPLHRTTAEALPDIGLHIVEAMSGTLDEWIQSGRLDVALLYDHKAFEHVAWTEMMVEDLMFVVPAAHPLAARHEIPFAQVFRQALPVVLPGRPNVLRTVIEQLAARHDVTPVATDCESLPAIAELVRARVFRGHHAAFRLCRGDRAWRDGRHTDRRSDAFVAPLGGRITANFECPWQRGGREGPCGRDRRSRRALDLASSPEADRSTGPHALSHVICSQDYITIALFKRQICS